MVLLALLGCSAAILQAYEREKVAVLADPGPPPENWAPEARLLLGEPLLQAVVQAALDAGLLAADDTLRVEGPLGIKAEVRPSFEARKVAVALSPVCATCFAVDASLRGKAVVRGLGATIDLPASADVAAVVELGLATTATGHDVWVRLREVSEVAPDIGTAGKIAVKGPVGQWIAAALERSPRLVVASVGGQDLPLRAARLDRAGASVDVQLLLDVSGGGPVDAPAGALSTPTPRWQLALSSATATALARRAAFERGIIAFGVAADPRALRFEGNTFRLDLRLWRLQGGRWWRDYVVEGDVVLERGKLRLVPTRSEEAGKSPGAGLADPLALLVEGRILDAVTDGVAQAIPASRSASMGNLTATATVTDVEGSGDAMHLRGTLDVTATRRGR